MPNSPSSTATAQDSSGGLLAKTRPGDNAPPLSVSEISGKLKRVVEGEFGHVRVRGELSGVKVAASGHLYATLKDDAAAIDLIMWKTGVQRLAFRPEDGVEVIATGRLTTYPGRSKYQIVAESLEIAGEGALLALLEKLKAKLAAEGLFAAERKRPLPYLPRVIGVITSPTGAVIRDILHRLEDRCPTQVVLWPVRVQGDGAAQEVAAAIDGFNALPATGAIARPDLIIVARGGGSIEDLWAFNDEAVVRALAASGIPTISAVGHETDTSLADHAADRRAPTPTAAAEMAVPVRADLLAAIRTLGLRAERAASGRLSRHDERYRTTIRRFPDLQRLLEPYRQHVDVAGGGLDRALGQFVALERQRLEGRTARLVPALLSRRLDRERERLRHIWARAVSPQRRLDSQRARLTEVGGWLFDAGGQRIARARQSLDRRGQRLRPALVTAPLTARRQRLAGVGRVMATLNPDNLLAKGYAMVLRCPAPAGASALVTSASDARTHDRLMLRFADGTVGVTVEDGAPGGPPSAASGESGKTDTPAPPPLATSPRPAPSPRPKSRNSSPADPSSDDGPRQGGLFD